MQNPLLVCLATLAVALLLSCAKTIAAEGQTTVKTEIVANNSSKRSTGSTLLASEIEPFNQATSVSELLAPQSRSKVKAGAKRQPNEIAQMTSVSQLSDVQPRDWAFQAAQSLVERYGCIEGYPDKIFRGNRAVTRFELAAALNACLNHLSQQLGGLTADDLATVKRLQDEFAAELAALRGRVDRLEARTVELEANQFSTTTKLTDQVILAVNGGGFRGERIVSSTKTEITDEDPNVTSLYRASLDFDTSFYRNSSKQALDCLQFWYCYPHLNHFARANRK